MRPGRWLLWTVSAVLLLMLARSMMPGGGRAEAADLFDLRGIDRMLSDQVVTVRLDQIMRTEASTVCVVAPYFNTDFEETPESALFRQMQGPFDSDAVTRLAVFDQEGELISNMALSRRFLETAPGLRAKCGRPDELVAQIGPEAGFSDITILE